MIGFVGAPDQLRREVGADGSRDLFRAGQAGGNYGRYYGEAIEDIAAFLAGDPIRRLG
ncbi:hypothetical protein ACFV4G_38315 [Kitasatospora sp. NPDC059747]|uniref:hypothetical protein n=1 Tax=Kitasatospora sp. NPDC059747 TaxID=3346930 RepID=UPI00365785A7